MKTKYILASLGVALMVAFTGCKEEDFTVPSADKIPLASDYVKMVHIDVDPETNQVTFNLDAQGVVPVWIIDGKTYSTVNGLQKIYAVAGDYEVDFKVYNSNGVSDGTEHLTFHIDKTIFDFDKYLTLLAGDGSREWRFDNKAEAHLGCGPSGTTGIEWWKASADEKADFGLYDNRLKFSKDYVYTFDPGAAGTIYVNVGVDRYPGYSGDADYNVPAEHVETPYSFDIVGPDLYLVLPKGTNFPYIPNNNFYDNPRLKIESITPSAFVLVTDDGDIAWHMILTSKADDTPKPFTGYVYNSDFNLWKNCNILGVETYYAAGNDWHSLPDPETTVSDDNSVLTIKLPTATDNQWQAQFKLHTDMSSTPASNYDYSVIITSTTDIKGATVKLTQDGDDGNFFFADQINLTAFEDYVYYMSDMPGIEAPQLMMVFDFGGCPENTEVTIKNIVFKDHANDDGTVLPGNDPEVVPGGIVWAGVDSADNLMTSGNFGLASCWWADNNWAQIADPAVTIDGRNVKIVAVENGGTRWQGQVHLNTGVAIEEGVTYDFRMVINPTQDLNGATVKPHPEGDDGHMFSEATHDLKAYEDNIVEYSNVTADFSTGNLVITLDFPGCANGTEILVKDIIIQLHNESAAPGGSSWVGVDSADNLMTSGNFGLASCWWADNNWAQIADPAVTINGRNVKIVAVENGGTRWQGQVHLNTGVAIEEGVTYDFRMVINPDQDLFGATVKPHPEGDDGHMFSEATHDLAAYEDNAVEYTEVTADFSTGNLVITLDFPGCKAGTVIEVKDIIIQKH